MLSMLLTLLTAASPFLAHGYVVPLPSSSTPTRLHLFHSDGFRGSPTRLQASSINVSDLDKKLKSCQSAREASRILESALGSTENGCLYNSVSIPPGAAAKGLSDGDLAIQTRLANKKYRIVDLIELSGDRDADRASLAIFCLMLASTGSALVANQSLPGPEIVRFLVVWLFSFAPLAFVGYGIATPEKLQTALVALQRNVFPAYRRRMLQHEAGHLLMAHLVGYPIAGYRVNAVKNAVELYPLQDANRGQDMARLLGFDESSARQGRQMVTSTTNEAREVPPFFSDEGRGALLVQQQSVFRKDKNFTDNPYLKLPSLDDPTGAWPYRGFDETTLDKLTLVALGGVCAEILAFGNAEGGLADISLLKQIFQSSEEEITEREVTNRIRYGLGLTITQLRRHLGVLDALAETMEMDGSVAQCIASMEECENLSGQDGIMGDYEVRRRQKFRTEGAGWIEQIFLGGDRNIDTDENRMVEGKGGGYHKQGFRLTGDDPLYAAMAVSLGFLLWASSGGLTLH